MIADRLDGDAVLAGEGPVGPTGADAGVEVAREHCDSGVGEGEAAR
jgi:hypothetical protein